MRRSVLGSVAALLAGILMTGCGSVTVVSKLSSSGTESVGLPPAPSTDAEKFLKWSMDRHAALGSYSSKCGWRTDYDGSASEAGTIRTLSYAKPNKFKIVQSARGGDFVMTSVCDGAKLAEFTNNADLATQTYEAPESIHSAASMQMKHPMFCGSLLYQFFGGSSNFDNLVDKEKGAVEFGKDETVAGEPARLVRFYGADTYGHVEVVIGSTSGLVHRIPYDSEPLMDRIKSAPDSPGVKGEMTPFWTTESYSDIVTDKPAPATFFAVNLPANAKLMERGSSEGPKPPVSIGSQAPDFTIVTLAGKKATLADFRGKVVLIDFWATWCPPCREGLPVTNKLHEKYTSRGLQVVTLTSEDKGIVSKFLAENKYTFPAYLDPQSAANNAYKVEAIPTMVVIDRQGKLVSYNVGLESEADILKNLKKAGLKVD